MLPLEEQEYLKKVKELRKALDKDLVRLRKQTPAELQRSGRKGP
jgi:hypothetical protein